MSRCVALIYRQFSRSFSVIKFILSLVDLFSKISSAQKMLTDYVVLSTLIIRNLQRVLVVWTSANLSEFYLRRGQPFYHREEISTCLGYQRIVSKSHYVFGNWVFLKCEWFCHTRSCRVSWFRWLNIAAKNAVLDITLPFWNVRWSAVVPFLFSLRNALTSSSSTQQLFVHWSSI